MSLVYPEKTTFVAGLTSTIDKESNTQMKEKIEAETVAKTKSMNQIPSARFKQVEKRKFLKK